MTCGQFNDLLLDYLYKTLDGPANARAAKHLRSCQACNRLVASYDRTLSKTRESLAGPLAEEPPSRVRFRAIAAAREYVSARQQPRSFFARLLRAPWFLPTCGAAAIGVVTFLVYTRKGAPPLPGMPPGPLDELQVVPEPSVAPSKSEGALPPHLDEAVRPPPPAILEKKATRGRSTRAAAKAKGSSERLGAGYAAEPPAELEDIDDLSARPSHAGSAGEAAGSLAAPSASTSVSEKRSYAQPPPAAPAPSQPLGARGKSAPPPAPPPSAAPAAAQPQSNQPMAPSRQRESDAVETKRKAVRDEDTSMQDFAPAEEEAPQKARSKQDTDNKAPAIDDAVQRADRMFASRQWASAAQAYRDLLARYPSHSDAPRWRTRLEQAMAAMQAE